ncbi:MAG: asparagine synthase (glutamine-hydrolyzing), partial [Ktedonobacteraceae bacterium]
MCGICGVYNAQSGQPAAARLIEHMMDVLVHRGPDDQGLYLERELGLGFQRLSIIDLTGGKQPVTNETGTIQLVFNGEIWNYRELQRELRTRGHLLRTQADAEVIVHAYEEDGPACIARLHGMFALALWDGSRKRLL